MLAAAATHFVVTAHVFIPALTFCGCRAEIVTVTANDR